MTARAPEGPKADFTAEEASGGTIPRPPSPAELDRLSEQQGMITDEWTGESREKDSVAEAKKPQSP
ncbi:hypothetical protein J8J14_00925 [Roseomonas sp. SSH11]|uniref:Uncharacterized protein n=1 Tax=Pararoseomonas baculiformis TaxID=2820812 RepID=A0ABS4A8K6_9PROT|nr:hypothetical protein [Pararoseomonas baculiformis]MBP0443327.1 hypothetical protein [Pararoseomonas baculiformis]